METAGDYGRQRTRTPPRVLLDTNALFLPFTRHFPLEQEIHRILEGARIEVPQSVRGELDRLVERSRPNARAARAYAERFPVVPTDLKGDAAIETLARDLGAIIVTADGELRRRLYAKGMKVLFPRGEKHLAFVQGPRPRRPGSFGAPASRRVRDSRVRLGRRPSARGTGPRGTYEGSADYPERKQRSSVP